MLAEGRSCIIYDVCYNRSVVEVAMTLKSLKLFLIDMAIQWLGHKYQTQLNSGNILTFSPPHLVSESQMCARDAWCLHKLIHYGGENAVKYNRDCNDVYREMI